MKTLTPFVANFPAEYGDVPEWVRLSFYDEESGEVYAPAGLTGEEQALFLGALYDGIGYVEDGGHVFLPVSWLRSEMPARPDFIKALDNIEKRTIAAFRKSEPAT